MVVTKMRLSIKTKTKLLFILLVDIMSIFIIREIMQRLPNFAILGTLQMIFFVFPILSFLLGALGYWVLKDTLFPAISVFISFLLWFFFTPGINDEYQLLFFVIIYSIICYIGSLIVKYIINIFSNRKHL